MRREKIDTEIERLYSAMRGGLFAYYLHRLPNPADAEDFVQRVFERLLATKCPPNSEGLLRLVAAGLLKNAYRDSARRGPDLSWEALAGPAGDGLDHLTQFQTGYDDSAFTEAFDASLRELDDDPRAAFILGELRGLPAREAGPLLGVSHATAAARRELATTTIRKELTA